MRCPAGRSLDADPRSSLSSVSQKRNREEGMWNSIQVGFTEHLRNVSKSVKVKWTPTLASRNSPAWQISIFQTERACALSFAVTRDDDSAARWMFGMPINYTLWNRLGCVYFTSILKKKEQRCKKKERILSVEGCLPVWWKGKDHWRSKYSRISVLFVLWMFVILKPMLLSELGQEPWERSHGGISPDP